MSRCGAALLGVLMIAIGGAASAQPYPSRQVHIIEPLAAASAVDVVARLIADKLSQDLGQAFYVDNQPGAAGLLGMRTGAKSAPDGYTLMAVNDAILCVLPNIRTDSGYDPLKDFVPVSLLAKLRWVLVVNPALPVNNVAEFIAYVKAHPGLDYGSGGVGSAQQIAMEMFMRATGTKLTHVPYRGVIQAFTDLVSGHVQAMFIALPAPVKLYETGQVKIIGFSELKRLPSLPNVPTIDEQGVKGFEFSTWAAMLAPTGTPRPVIDKLNASIKKAIADPEVNKKLVEFGDEPVGSTPEELKAIIDKDFADTAELIKAANIHAE